MTNVDINIIHAKIFGVTGTISMLPEPIDTCDAQQLILGWLDYAFNSGTEREITMRYKSLGANYALQKLLCNVPDIQASWRCDCNLPKPQFSQGNQVFPCSTTPHIISEIRDDALYYGDANHVSTYIPSLLPTGGNTAYSLLWETGDKCSSH
jgi:hypothetical protein